MSYTLSIRIPVQLGRRLDAVAAARNKTKSELARVALETMLQPERAEDWVDLLAKLPPLRRKKLHLQARL